ncbi:iron-sulfur cluster repair protein YtfE [Bisgaard Taxon 10/6]|uniref:iron-sulfur cluster repair protein YtfE n=1 Tax=Exercitatus varius TaxID=67857 RepID=UPI00294B4014|nr:iron-sulfur cluster repair protein YtfE [Exercitatus varius]MDG2947836.1 iron-sulfur cluster repair protein YtfE [Exercitatus varius]
MSFAHQKLGEIAVAIPGATQLFREYDLDFCCGGAEELSAAVQQKNLNLAEIEAKLLELRQNAATPENDWTTASYDEFTRFIVARFHERHRAQLPELIRLAETVERVHAERDDCPTGVMAELQALYEHLSQHMMKEEQILFPMIRAGNYAMATMPIRVMEAEHAEAGDQLETLKALTNNVTAPADACATWRALYAGISTFIDDLMEHTHLENNILFPRVRAEV